MLGPSFVEVTWQAPPLVHHNGAILSYIIRYFPSNDLNKMEDLYATVDQDEAILHTMLTDLVPFTRYSFKVSAVNAVGAGPFSVAVEGTTEVDGECMHAVLIEWSGCTPRVITCMHSTTEEGSKCSCDNL